MEIPDALVNLAESLKYAQPPYNLLLTSTISLTPEVLQEICGSSQWNVFGDHLRGFAYTHRINLLRRHLDGHKNANGYQSLARLIEKKMFTTVLTTNLDSTLEDMLSKSSSTYRALVVGRDMNEHIANALDSGISDIRIIKLHGSLRDDVLSETYPDFIELKETITSGLTRYINQDIVIIGSIEREDDIASLLAKSKGSIYYAVPDKQLPNDKVTRIIRARGYEPTDFVIYGSFGQFERFCNTLESLITNPATSKKKVVTLTNQPAQAPLSAYARPPRYTPVDPPELASSPPQPSVEQRKPESSGTSEPQEKETSPISSMVIKIVSGVVAIAALLFAVSLFLNLTPSFNSAFIIPLIIILAVIILGIMGILRADQIVQIFLQGLTLKGSNDTSGSTEAASTDSSTPSQSSSPSTTIKSTAPQDAISGQRQSQPSLPMIGAPPSSTPAHEEGPGAVYNGNVLQEENNQSAGNVDSEASFPVIQKPEGKVTHHDSNTSREAASPPDADRNGSGNGPSLRTVSPSKFVELSPDSHDDSISRANQYYDAIMQSKGAAQYAHDEVFAEGTVVEGSQYGLFINFLHLTVNPVQNLLVTAEDFPDDIKSLRYPLVEALHDIIVIINSLELSLSRSDRASLRREIQSKFKALANGFVKVEEAFDKLGIKNQDRT